MNFNKVVLVGRLTRDIEMRYTPKGVAIATFSLAVNRDYKLDNGEKRQESCFVDCTIFGTMAETFAQYQKKGDEPLVEGRLRTEEWVDKQTNQKRHKLGLIVESFQFGSKRDAHADVAPPPVAPRARVPDASVNAAVPSAPPTDAQTVAPSDGDDDSIPF